MKGGDRALGAVLALAPIPRALRYRLRLRRPDAAAAADRVADASLAALLAVTAMTVAAAFVVPRRLMLLPLFAAVGLLTGVPYVIERRSLRRRLRTLVPPADPLTAIVEGPHAEAARILALDPIAAAALLGEALAERPADVDALVLRALAAAAAGDPRTARACALATLQRDRTRWRVLADTGTVLCRRGHFGEGLRLLRRAVDAAPPAAERDAERALAAGLAVSGRLREAAQSLDRVEGRSRPVLR